MDIRNGFGIDFHIFENNRKMVLGGVEFDTEYGLKGHSDADVVLHALMDAILGACGLNDIGYHFPDNDNSFKDIDSTLLLKRVLNIISEKHFYILNTDITIVGEKPRINPMRERIRANIARLLNLETERVNVKATTTEQMGAIGRKEGLATMAVVLVEKRK